MTLADRLSRAVALRTVGHLFGTAVSAVTLLLLARYLGPDQFGLYVTATTLITLVWVIADGGIVSVGVRDMAARRLPLADLAAAVNGARLVGSGVGIAVAVALGGLVYRMHGPLVVEGTAVLAVMLPLFAVTGGVRLYAEGTLRTTRLAVGEAAGRLAMLLAVLLFVLVGLRLPALFAAPVFGATVSCAVLLAGHRRVVAVRVTLRRPAWTTLRTALPLGLTLIMNAVYFRADTLILAALRPVAEVAYYGLAYRALEIVLTVGAFVVSAMLPVLSGCVDDPHRWRAHADAAMRFLCGAGVAVAGCGMLVADQLVRLVGGNRFGPAADALVVLLLSVVFSWVSGVLGVMLISVHRQRQAMWVNATGLVLNVVSNLAFVPRYGYLAAATITVASELVFVLGALLVLYRHTGYRWRLPGPLPVLSLAAAAIAVTYGLRVAGSPVELTVVVVTAGWLLAARRLGLLPPAWRSAARTAGGGG